MTTPRELARQHRQLAALEKAAAGRIRADERWRTEVLAALDAGLSGRAIGAAAGVSHARIYQIAAETGRARRR